MNSKLKFDCIVIGAGIGGLLVSNILTSKGKKVLLLEKNSYPGGAYSKLKLREYEMDLAVSYMLGFEKEGWLSNIFKEVFVKNKVDFVKIQVPDRYIFPDFEFDLISDLQILKQDFFLKFPNETANISEFFLILKKLYDAMSKYQSSGKYKIDPIILKYLDIKYIDYIETHFNDSKLKAILSARIFGSEVDFVTMAVYLGKLIIDGLYQEVSKGDIAHILANNLIERGAEIRYNHLVSRIPIENKRATGAFVDNLFFEAEYIISACDMSNIFCDTIKPDICDEIKHKITSKPLSLSSISLYLVLKDIPISIKKRRVARIYLFDSYDIKAIYSYKENNILDVHSAIKVNIPNISDDDFLIKDKYYLRVEIDTSLDSVNETIDLEIIKNEIIEILISKLSIIKENILESVLVTPKTFMNLIGSSKGAASGWSPNFHSLDIPIIEKSIAENIFQTGCWDQYGSGILPILFSAQRVTREILTNNLNIYKDE